MKFFLSLMLTLLLLSVSSVSSVAVFSVANDDIIQELTGIELVNYA